MHLIDSIISHFTKKEQGQKAKAPEGICPNCWGEQEWDGKYVNLVEEKQIDVNNHSQKYSFINEFVVEHMDGIRLKKTEQVFHCPTCEKHYHHHHPEG